MAVSLARGPQTAGLHPLLLFVALLLLGAGVLAALFGTQPSTTEAPAPRVTVDELLLHVPREVVNVRGTLVRNSLTQQEEPCSAEFRIKGQKGELRVRYAKCVLPEKLCDRARSLPEVHVKGQFDPHTLRLEATSMRVLEDGKYEEITGPDGNPARSRSSAMSAAVGKCCPCVFT